MSGSLCFIICVAPQVPIFYLKILLLNFFQVREALELSLEEDLFAKLVFLYRSPETMIKWSRPKEEDDREQRALPAPQ